MAEKKKKKPQTTQDSMFPDGKPIKRLTCSGGGCGTRITYPPSYFNNRPRLDISLPRIGTEQKPEQAQFYRPKNTRDPVQVKFKTWTMYDEQEEIKALEERRKLKKGEEVQIKEAGASA